MTIAWFKDASAAAAAPRGGAPVGMLAELPAVELGAVLLLRLWCDGDAGRAQIADDFTLAFGTPRADVELERLAALVRTLLQGTRRPLMRHRPECACFGGDESVFANMVGAAAAGDHEDALAFAMLLMSPGAACDAVQLAGPVGLAILGLARTLRGLTRSPSQEFTRH